MFWTVVAPEILPCWAPSQFLAAMTVRDVYNEGKGELCRCSKEAFEASSGYREESSGLRKRWFSLFELPADKRRGGYLPSVILSEVISKNITSMVIEAWSLPHHGRISSR